MVFMTYLEILVREIPSFSHRFPSFSHRFPSTFFFFYQFCSRSSTKCMWGSSNSKVWLALDFSIQLEWKDVWTLLGRTPAPPTDNHPHGQCSPTARRFESKAWSCLPQKRAEMIGSAWDPGWELCRKDGVVNYPTLKGATQARQVIVAFFWGR